MGSEHLKSASWWFFDLDDTLHEFRIASSAAVDAALQLIAQQQAQQIMPQRASVVVTDLKTAYLEVLRERTSSAFIDGKTSHEYRAERFTSAMNALKLSSTMEQIAQILDIYEKTLMEQLTLKPGVISLLKLLKQQGKYIAIVTEGPQDAQERTVAALGLEPYLDRLITTNAFRAAKVDGLFERALDVLGIKSKDVVMVGDSWDRDVLPAAKLGISCVWYAEGNEEGEKVVDFGGQDEARVVLVNSLGKLQSIVQGI
jgi:putative hydrolase of the HAD superfamily